VHGFEPSALAAAMEEVQREVPTIMLADSSIGQSRDSEDRTYTLKDDHDASPLPTGLSSINGDDIFQQKILDRLLPASIRGRGEYLETCLERIVCKDSLKRKKLGTGSIRSPSKTQKRKCTSSSANEVYSTSNDPEELFMDLDDNDRSRCQ
jgi:hypothetical protein